MACAGSIFDRRVSAFVTDVLVLGYGNMYSELPLQLRACFANIQAAFERPNLPSRSQLLNRAQYPKCPEKTHTEKRDRVECNRCPYPTVCRPLKASP